jgi:UDP-2,3-diacylglucosamine pyrophosphatase LpxH
MPLFVCSDMHLGEPGAAALFHDGRQGMVFADLCAHISRVGGELVLLGDVFDVTASTPPRKGMTEFGKAVGVPTIFDLTPGERPTVAGILGNIRKHNPRAVDALDALSEEVPVTFVPGNHDRHLGEAGGREALDAMGLRRVVIAPMAVRKMGERNVVLQHGHAWDPSNATATGGGEVLTGVLHHAIIPFLRAQAKRTNIHVDVDRLVSLRPEERVVPVIERWLPEHKMMEFIDAFTELLVENGSISRMISWLVTSDRIRERLRDDDDLWERAGRSALAALEGTHALPGRPPPPDILVLGHTHVIDWAVQEGPAHLDARTHELGQPRQRLYVNLGSWTSRATDAAGPVDAALPVLELHEEPQALSATLRDLGSKSRALQSFEVPR